jgi:hypothetical protein
MRHLDEGTIHAWLDGALPVDEAERVARHASSCAECAHAVADARGLIAGTSRIVSSLDAVRGGAIPPQSSPVTQRSLWRTLHFTPGRAALAATLLLAIASTLVLSRQGPIEPSAETANARHPSTEAAAPPAAERAVPVPAPATVRRSVEASKSNIPAPRQPVIAAAPPPPLRDSAVAATDAEMRSRKAEAPAGAVAGARSGTMQLSEIVAAPVQAKARGFAANSQAVASDACYRLTTDSAWTRSLSERFALVHDSTSGANVVHAVSQGRVDSVIPGAHWARTLTAGENVWLFWETHEAKLDRADCRP